MMKTFRSVFAALILAWSFEATAQNIGPAPGSSSLVIGTTAITGGTDTRVLFQDGTTVGQDAGLTFGKTAKSLTIGGATLTGASAPVLNLTQTWNNAATVFTGISLNVTNTASAFASNLADFRRNGVSVTSIRGDGLVSVVGLADTAGSSFYLAGNGVFLASSLVLAWTDGGPFNTVDIGLRRDAAGVLAQRNGVSAQKDRLYASFTDASNGSWAEWDTTTAATLILATNGNGSGLTTMGKFQINILGVNKLDFGVTTAAVWTASVPIASASTIRPGGFTVAGLPAAGTAGRIAYVTDQLTTCAVKDAALTGGGAKVCAVFDTGAAWVGM